MNPDQHQTLKERLQNASTKEKAFEEFYELLVPRLLAWVIRELSNRDDAEDLVQETFARFWAIENYTKYDNLENLVFKMAINQIKDLRKHGKVVEKHEVTLRNSDAEKQSRISVDLKIDLMLSTRNLSSQQRKSFALVMLGASTDEVAKALNIHYNTSRKHIQEAIRKVQRNMFDDSNCADVNYEI